MIAVIVYLIYLRPNTRGLPVTVVLLVVLQVGKSFNKHELLPIDPAALFWKSIFIDQAALNGTRPDSPEGVEPAVTPN